MLAGWTRREPYAAEPGPVAVGIHRFVAILATAVLIAAAVLANASQDAKAVSAPTVRASAISLMWGVPDPVVVDRVFVPDQAAPDGLVAQPVLRYQKIDGLVRDPPYLFNLKDYLPVAGSDYLGQDPSPGLSALDDAYVVVQVRADPACVPRQVVAIAGTETVTVGVYYGPPTVAAGQPASTAVCVPNLSDDTSLSTLIPIKLDEALGSRTLVTLDGAAIPPVPVINN